MNNGFHKALGRVGFAFLILLASMMMVGSGAARAQTCGTKVMTLMSGGFTPEVAAGTVTVSNDNANLYVTVALSAGVNFANTGIPNLRLWVGNDPANVPNFQGLPLEQSFPISATASDAQAAYTLTVPFTELAIQDAGSACGMKLYFNLYASIDVDGVRKIGWGGESFTQWNPYHWYGVGTYVVCCDFGPPPVEQCSTAFGKGGYVWTTDPKSNPEGLPSLNLTKNRWGWAINLKTPGSLTTPLYAGAGLNTTSKGKLVGTVTVNWSGSSVTVTYLATTGDLKEVHVYAGDRSPTTLAPGQYGSTAYLTSGTTSYTVTRPVSDTNGDGIWVVAHAVSCY